MAQTWHVQCRLPDPMKALYDLFSIYALAAIALAIAASLHLVPFALVPAEAATPATNAPTAQTPEKVMHP